MTKAGSATQVSLKTSEDETLTCDGCIFGKGHRALIPKKRESRSANALDLVHSDFNGPLEVQSVRGSRNFITFIDEFSKWTVAYTVHRNSDSLSCFTKYHKYAEAHTGAKVKKIYVLARLSNSCSRLKALRTDNGAEYLSTEFNNYLAENGIEHQLTVAYTSQQNGVAERMSRTLIDLVRSLLHSKGLGKRFWGEALSTAEYIRNRVTTRSLPSNITQFHLWMGKAPDLFASPHIRLQMLVRCPKEQAQEALSSIQNGH